MLFRSIRPSLLTAAAFLAAFAVSITANAQTVVITVAPPPLPVYQQTVCPSDGYIWTPGYWAWDGDYYWVPGTWVNPPETGFVWTPGYWAWRDGGFFFNEGYWAPTMGYYGGIDYGFGYFGHGYEGGRWSNGHFEYNTAVSRVDKTVERNVYSIDYKDSPSRVSYNGGKGGVSLSPSEPESKTSALAGTHVPPTPSQIQHAWAAKNDPAQHFASNHGVPRNIATNFPTTAVHPNELPPVRPVSPNTGSADLDHKIQQQQDSLVAKQKQELQKLQQKQDAEDQQAKQKADPVKTQQLEQVHRRQTQQLVEAHARQMDQIKQK